MISTKVYTVDPNGGRRQLVAEFGLGDDGAAIVISGGRLARHMLGDIVDGDQWIAPSDGLRWLRALPGHVSNQTYMFASFEAA